ncbi:pancreatic triacylglycerol lipase-like isoform X2 [Stegodyphus dumicola]|uniref:pancreatic triacylglycerol lipase-like isoform X2 n=1 Tax=Stegodyphus dumicola TaxID=202533 RepID=UPI0015AB0618|nr:pancreatic triacylglycerol lipase-like isoform X2 [Stegodyphus dumicola]
MAVLLTLVTLVIIISIVKGRAMLDAVRGSYKAENGVICEDNLGCFGNKPPYNHMMLPDPAEEIGTEFRLFRLRQQEIPLYITNRNFSLWAENENTFEQNLRTVFIIHGFRDGNAKWPLLIKDALLEKGNFNVFIVDWSKGAAAETYTFHDYDKVVSNTRIVGAEVGLFIHYLMDVKNLDPQNIHIIGHSLGSHISGFASKWIQQNDTKVIGGITGLDPAGPCFYESPPTARLDRTDAEFVDIIHTIYALSPEEGFGLKGPLGHFDFYPNGGVNQPGCKSVEEAESTLFNEISSNPLKLFTLIKKLSSGKSQESGCRSSS